MRLVSCNQLSKAFVLFAWLPELGTVASCPETACLSCFRGVAVGSSDHTALVVPSMCWARMVYSCCYSNSISVNSRCGVVEWFVQLHSTLRAAGQLGCVECVLASLWSNGAGSCRPRLYCVCGHTCVRLKVVGMLAGLADSAV
jgi:hypothetical protein